MQVDAVIVDPMEKHYSTKEVAEAWGIDKVTVLAIFEREPGVLRLGPVKEVRRRTRRELRIPASILARVYESRISRHR
jgi:hypothetical protein